MRFITLLCCCVSLLCSAICGAEQKKVILYVYSSEVTRSDFQLGHLARYYEINERLKSLLSEIDPDAEVVALDIAEASKMQTSPSGISDAEIDRVGSSISELVSRELAGKGPVRGLIFDGHGNETTFVLNDQAYGGRTFGRLVSNLLGKLRIDPTLAIHFQSCLLGAHVPGGKKNFQDDFSESLANEMKREDQKKIETVHVTAHVHLSTPSSVSHSEWLEWFILKSKVPSLVNKLLFKLAVHPVALPFISYIPAFLGIAATRLGWVPEGLGPVAIGSGVALSGLSRLADFANSKVVRHLVIENGNVSKRETNFTAQVFRKTMGKSCNDALGQLPSLELSSHGRN